MHKIRTKKMLTLMVAGALGLASLSVIGNGRNAPITITTDFPLKSITLKQLNLGTPETSTEWKLQGDVLTVGIKGQNPANKVSGKMSQVGGRDNTANANPDQPGYGSVIIGGEGNTTTANSKYGAIVASSGSHLQNSPEGATILASQGAVVLGSNSAILTSAKLPGATLEVGGAESGIIASNSGSVSAKGSLAIGNDIAITHDGVFAFNGKHEKLTSAKEHTFIVNVDNGFLIGKNNPDANPQLVPLQVHGAIKVAKADLHTPKNAIVLKTKKLGTKDFSCLCINQKGAGMSLSSRPECEQVCEETS